MGKGTFLEEAAAVGVKQPMLYWGMGARHRNEALGWAPAV
jgi:hypothetical protein